MQAAEQIPRGKRMPTDILFFINGITSLLGYNALLNSLDYFNLVYDGYGVYNWFLPPIFLGYVIIAVSFKFISDKWSYKILISFGLITVNFTLFILLIFSFFSDDSKTTGFVISLFCCLLLGVGNNSYQLSCFAMINYLSFSVVSKFTIGTAAGGLMITTLRMIIVGIAGPDDSLKAPIIIFILIAIIFNFFTMFANWSFLKSRQYKIKLLPFLPKSHQPTSTQQSLEQGLNPRQSAINNSVAQDQKQQETQTNYFKLLYLTAKSIFPYPILIFGTYIVTFLVFPNLCVHKTYDDLDFVWSSLIFFLMYNLGDTAGKFICDYRSSFNITSIFYMFSARAYFLIAIPLLATKALNDDVLANNYFYPELVQFLFALTNGVMTNACFILSFQNCPVKYKKYAGVLGGICLQIGILVGTNLAIPFSSMFITE